MTGKRVVLGVGSQPARKLASARLGTLSDNFIAPATLKRYQRHCTAFFSRLRQEREPLAKTALEFDFVLCRYM